MINSSTWILVANASIAYLYNSDNLRTGKITLVKELLHPDSRKKSVDLTSDRSGSTSGSAYDKGKSTPKDLEAEHFALELVKEIQANCHFNKTGKLIVVAPSHFYASLKKHLHIHLPEVTHIAKDYTKYTTQDLLVALREHLFG